MLDTPTSSSASENSTVETAKVTPISPAGHAISQAPTPSAAPERAAVAGLGLWSFYFLLKLLMAWQEIIGFHALENLAFAAALTLPLSSPKQRRIRQLAAIPLAIALLYYDSWLPPIGRAFATLGLLASFSLDYWEELAGRVLRWPLIAGLVLAWVGYRWLDRYVRMGTVVMLAMAAMLARPLVHSTPGQAASQAANGAASESNDDALKAFYAQESQKTVSFAAPPASAPPFDIVFLHVCSLSWDDLHAVGLDTHPLWQRFDVLMTHFNSAASYSGPAAIRLHRGACGQRPHSALYDPAADACYLMDDLKQAGFQPNLAMNHDGHFDDFLNLVQSQKFKVPPMSLANLPVALKAFDDTPVYDDYATLSRWLEQRKDNAADRVALYYNTISLHDGNKYPNSKGASLDSYKPRLQKLLDDMNRFIDTLEKSGRRAVLVVIPEHGAAIRGDKMQIAGLREIPSPAITEVPVGVRVIGPQLGHGNTVKVDEPTSYVAVNQLVARLMEAPPFTGNSINAADYTADLPTTEPVSENEDTVVMTRNGKVMMRQGKDGWAPYESGRQ